MIVNGYEIKPFASLSDANLSCADLTGANLSDANLSCADLTGTNLIDADLSDANLRYADLKGANLRYADLFGANLSDANLFSANLSDANLFSANLIDANLSDADLKGANLSCADLTGTCLKGAIIEKIIGMKIELFEGSKHHAFRWNDKVTIGCKTHSIEYWLENYQKIGKEHEYSDNQIEEYGKFLNSLGV